MDIFFILCSAIGVLQFFENSKLLLQKGEQLLFDHSFSVLETLWLVVVVWFLTKNEMSQYGYFACGFFIAYHLFGWLVGFQSIKLARDSESDTLIIPLWYFKCNLFVNVVFIVFSLLAIA